MNRPPTAADFGAPRLNSTAPPIIAEVQKVLRVSIPQKLHAWFVERVGHDCDLARLHRCYLAWIAKGFKETNIDGWTGWYVNGTPEEQEARDAKRGQGWEYWQAPTIPDAIPPAEGWKILREAREKNGSRGLFAASNVADIRGFIDR